MTPLRHRFIEELRRRNRSPRTIETYTRVLARLARHFNTAPDLLTFFAREGQRRRGRGDRGAASGSGRARGGNAPAKQGKRGGRGNAAAGPAGGKSGRVGACERSVRLVEEKAGKGDGKERP